jgi:hypothetical protein
VPVLAGVSESERVIGVGQAAALVKIHKGFGMPLFLNADHTGPEDYKSLMPQGTLVRKQVSKLAGRLN